MDKGLLQKSTTEFDRLAFTVLAIEASAQKMSYNKFLNKINGDLNFHAQNSA